MCGLTVNDPIKGKSFCFLIRFLSQHPELDAICLFLHYFLLWFCPYRKRLGLWGREAEGKRGGCGLQPYIFFAHWPSHCGRKCRR